MTAANDTGLDYKATLNLPETAFSMKANLAQREPAWIAACQEAALYEKRQALAKGKPKFLLHDGPPYANGHLHCGHALNKILKDMVCKSKSLSGFDAPFVPGWDCHGLPIELNVEKKYGKAGQKLSAAEFREQCRAYAMSQLDIQREEFKRLGVFADWQNRYATSDFSYEANIIRALGKIIDNGHLEQGFKPVHWCVACGSALAEAEVEYEDKTSDAIYVAFRAVDAERILSAFHISAIDKTVIVPIWTTTPWTLPANEAVCLHPELEYILLERNGSYLFVAEGLADELAKILGESKRYEGSLPGSLFEGIMLAHPFEARTVPIILGDHVTADTGTGAVHTAPAHGPEDYVAGQRYKLPLRNPVLGNGQYSDDVPLFAGQPVLKANEAVIAVLKERGNLLHHSSMTHSYPHCWRHKIPVIFRATPQWFISMEKNGLRTQMLKAIDTVEWVPDWGYARIQSMIKTRPDWCISRQRAWGTPMPLFTHKKTGALHPNTSAILETVAQLVEQQGIEAWFSATAESLLGADAKDYDKSQDTLDVWFDSGVSHAVVLQHHASLTWPADLYLEGSDQHRGWFNSSLTTSVAMYGKAPYKTVLTHGFTVDAEGKKLSKSKGNYIALDKLVGDYGADILRLWVASTDFRYEVSLSDEILKRTAEAYRRIRNTARFLLANTCDFNPEQDAVSGDKLLALDAYIVEKAKALQAEIIEAYEGFQFHMIAHKLQQFCTVDLGGFYLDIIKDRQYTSAKESLARRSCQTAMFHILEALVRWLAPVVSFTADEIWSFMPNRAVESVHLATWYEAWPTLKSNISLSWDRLMVLRDEVNKALEKARHEGVIGSSLAAEVRVYADGQDLDVLEKLGEEARFFFICSAFETCPLVSASPESYHSAEQNLAVLVRASTHEKCARCWHRRPEVGQVEEHPLLCQRCVDNIGEHWESRELV